jgi:ferric-dicitrate binding protein FerR (iron transport regulator)
MLHVVSGNLGLRSATGTLAQATETDVGRQIPADTWLRTDPESRAALELEGGQSLRLDNDTRVRLNSSKVLELARGAVYIDSEGGAASGVEVRTHLGVARDIGTQFEVRSVGDTVAVKVRHGAVSLTHAGEELNISNGTGVTVSGDGSRQTFAIEPFDSEWTWAQEVAPSFEIEGRAAMDLLDWVSRETGLWVRFADPEVETFALETTLHGSIEGLNPAEAAYVVLPTCGLEAVLDTGTLIVSRTEDSSQSLHGE